MALNLGNDFKTRWLSAPTAVRSDVFERLANVRLLLSTETNLNEWKAQEQIFQTESQNRVTAAYQEIKQNIIDELNEKAELAKQAKQAALLAKLEERQKQQQAEQLAIFNQLAEQHKKETNELIKIQQQLNQEIFKNSNKEIPLYSSKAWNDLLCDEQALYKAYIKIHDPSQQTLQQLKTELVKHTTDSINQLTATFRKQLQVTAREQIQAILKQQLESK